MRLRDCVSRSVNSKYSTRLVRLCIFSSWLFTIARMSYISIVDAEEGGRAGVSDFNDFGVAVSFDVVVADLSVVKGDDHLFETMFLIERLVLEFFFFAFVCHGLNFLFSGGYPGCF